MSQWKILKSKTLLQSGFFRLREDQCELPDGRVMPRYYVMEFSDWVNVVAITHDLQMIMIHQHRHGADGDFLEIPGGAASPGEDPREAGRRELREETGFEAGEWIDCGDLYPNPALQSNRMHVYLALGCRKVTEPELDPFEDLKAEVMPIARAYGILDEGGIQHSLIAASMGLAKKELRKKGIA